MKADRSDLVDIEVFVKVWPKPYLSVGILLDEDDDSRPIFLPLSQIEIDKDPPYRGVATVTLPEWLAIDKGLI